MQTQEIKLQSNTESWQREVSHFMPADRGIMAFVPAGHEELDRIKNFLKRVCHYHFYHLTLDKYLL